MTTASSLHVCLDSPLGTSLSFTEVLDRVKPRVWRIAKGAMRGDRVLIYSMQPVSAIVGRGVLVSKPFDESNWGYHAGRVGEFSTVERPAPVDDLDVVCANCTYSFTWTARHPCPSKLYGLS